MSRLRYRGGFLPIVAVALGMGLSVWALAEPVPAPALSAGVEQVKLSVANLGGAVPVYSPADGASPLVSSGVLQTRQRLVFTPSKTTVDLALGDATVKAGWNVGQPEFAIRAGTSVFDLKVRPDASCDPVSLEIAKGRSYVLAFPQAYAATTAGELFYRSGTVQKGTVGGQPIAFYDYQTDGKYSLSRDGVRYGNPSGAVALFAPAARYAATRTAVVEFKDLTPEGTELTAAKYAGPTGKPGRYDEPAG